MTRHGCVPDCPCVEWDALSDPTRWTVVMLLADGERTVSDLLDRVDVEQNVLSYHLAVLRDAGLVTTQRDGRWIHYHLAEDVFARLHVLLPGCDCHPATAPT
jgi:ArsR family transcriptional regulator, arsenate/arsenite/antimonite-responsive transcriptional repressor